MAGMQPTMPQPPPTQGLRPHPYLQDPVIYVSNLALNTTETDLANALAYCIPFRPTIDRDASGLPIGTGNVVFKHFYSAEKALATLQSRPIPFTSPPLMLSLSPYPPTTPPMAIPPPGAQPRLVKHLPDNFTDSDLYDLFRPFGCLASVRVQAGFGPGTGVVEFCYEEEAHVAEESMHCAEVQDQMIGVQVYQPRKGTGPYLEFSPNAPAFVPSGSVVPFGFSSVTPPRSNSQSFVPPVSPTFIHGPGQQVQLAPLSGPGSTSHSGLIDPCNLFIKNIDSEIDSNGLFNSFRGFGQIVSARVMRNELGASRGFGFVSYQTPDQAAHAMQAMNGVTLGSKQVIVRLHEPKQLRQEKLAQRFGGQGSHPRSGSGATSPTLSEGEDSYGGWPSPGHAHPGLADRTRRSSGSYYTAALAGTLNLPMQYEDLVALSPVVRREVLSGELSRRIKNLEGVASESEVDAIVDSIVGLSLTEVVEGIHDQSKLVEQVHTAQHNLSGNQKLTPPDKSVSSSPAPSQDSRVLDPQALIATASAPEHPSTPLSVSGSISDPPRTSSPSASPAPPADKDRLLAAVARLEPSQAETITNLLMSLSKRERAMCLFSAEILKQKVAEAKEIVALENDDDEPRQLTGPMTPITKKSAPASINNSPRTPELSSRGPSTVASPMPITPGASSAGDTHTLASLARLPAQEIVKMASSDLSASNIPLPKADSLVIRSTDEFIDSLKGQPVQQQKQALGEKLFKFVKAAGGSKLAGKITIQLLDTEDLRSLAHLLNSYPDVLKEKVTLVQKMVAAK